jgi:hypothetical protein
MKRTLATRTATLLLTVPLTVTACSGGDVDAELPSVDVDGGNLDVETPEVDAPDVDAEVDADVEVDESPS